LKTFAANPVGTLAMDFGLSKGLAVFQLNNCMADTIQTKLFRWFRLGCLLFIFCGTGGSFSCFFFANSCAKNYNHQHQQ